MSTVRFDAEELGNVAAFLALNHSNDLAGMCDLLACYSKANTAEYSDRYNVTVKVLTSDEIKASAPVAFDRARAIGTIKLLAYNADPSLLINDTDRMEFQESMTQILERAFYRVTER